MIPLLTANGLLPPGRHTATPDECRLRFVDAFPAINRRLLYEEWQSYSERIQTLLQLDSLVQWIDGSFVTDKPNPGDLDLVTFVPYAVYDASEEMLIEFYSTTTLHSRGLDAYICPVYPVNHQRYALYRQFKRDWQRLFSNHRTLTDEKGFLAITLSYGE